MSWAPHIRTTTLVCSLTAMLAPYAVRLHSALAQEYDPQADLRARREPVKDRYKRLKADRDELQALLLEREKAGMPTGCAKQILAEARWLIGYTVDFDRASARLAELRQALGDEPTAQGLEQSEADGSWGSCTQAWFLKLDATVDQLTGMNALGQTPRSPLRFLDRINTPDELTAYLDSISSGPSRNWLADREDGYVVRLEGLGPFRCFSAEPVNDQELRPFVRPFVKLSPPVGESPSPGRRIRIAS